MNITNNTSSNDTSIDPQPRIICPNGYLYVKGECIKSKEWIMAISIGSTILILIVLIIVIIAWILSRRRTTRKGNTYKYTQVEFNNFPLTVSKNTLTFENEGRVMQINKAFHDEINVYNPSEIEKTFKIESNSSQYSIECEPRIAILGPHSSINVYFTITLLCTCKEYEAIQLITFDGISEENIEDDDKMITPLYINVTGEDSILIDYKEIEFIDTIKNGNNGIVSTGKYNNQNVIIKRLNLKWNSNSYERFINSLKELTKLRSPLLINIIGAVTTPEHECMILEYAEHGNARTCYRRGEMQPLLRAKIFEDVCKGLEFLYQNKQIHGNIKPTNMLIVSLNIQSTVCCKLGHYWNISQMTGLPKLTINEEEMLQSTYYNAPEVLKGNECTKESDVYSLGMSMLEIYQEKMLYPERPFSNAWDAALEISKGKRPTIPDTVDLSIKSLIQQCWNQEIEQRPQLQEIYQFFTSLKEQIIQQQEPIL
ncbi:protein kinase domain containing protein [Entamoeba nuttalli P19]|uniref:Protein kinase domain containing protein n=1 Tax=Entamoeba nuttalli (strain P19) TaxID=1076696 RepID=K2H064_ENTNP|nr:protein kinase domain containing protein [Entamoeba nuttalli P19]EKE39607.1 protein kinase domain containing protein [Entamoeba nuttalli P19]|eukprot:XP_008858058.1 protein kinase domain containing protein [Entamoeba nuttalli P19]